MYRYEHGGNAAFELDKRQILDLSANINPIGFQHSVRDSIISEISFCNRYPDNFSTSLTEKIAEFEGIDKRRILCANGASDIIFRLVASLKPRKVLVTAPTFADYERAAVSQRAQVIYNMLSEKNGFKITESIIEQIETEKPDIIFICNPNNPTGVLCDYSLIEKIVKTSEKVGAVIVIDECFLDFIIDPDLYSAKSLLSENQNLVILKAFTKIFALPGIRLGYCLCGNTSFPDKLRLCGPDWPVSNLAQAAGIASLMHADAYLQKTREFVETERLCLMQRLQALGFTVFDSMANYIFFKSRLAFDLAQKLDEKDIRIRSCANYIGLSERHCRIAVSTKENNNYFIKAMEEILECQNK